MNDAIRMVATLEQTFTQIYQQHMLGLPLLNNRLKVEVRGVQEYQGRTLAIIITPWMMNLLLLPAEAEDWSALQLGEKQVHSFPEKDLQFSVNEFQGLGKCQTFSLYSPMDEFVNQDHALSAAQVFIETLMVETEATDESIVDQALLGRIMRGEETAEVNLDDFALINAEESSAAAIQSAEIKVQVKKTLSRRDLLRGNFHI
ncbi:hypothetical protein MNBD_GAMMA25-2573 [hydrothermal vent metagenome]|uniref:Uncharacterized protein n=1 Tax=hydrothermal vent metagenome TaxID=652676 RepID=A0A3B1AQL6_9ZZZZ